MNKAARDWQLTIFSVTCTDPEAQAIEVLQSGIANTSVMEKQVLDLYWRLTDWGDPVIDPLALQSSLPELYNTIDRYEEIWKAEDMQVTKTAWGEDWKSKLFGGDNALGWSKTHQLKELANNCGDLSTVQRYLSQEIAQRKVPNQGRSKNDKCGGSLASVSRAEIMSATASYLADKAAREQEASYDMIQTISSEENTYESVYLHTDTLDPK